MLIAHVMFKVAPDQRQLALDALLAEATEVRAMAGCLSFQPFLVPDNPSAVGIIHEWDSTEHFAAYASSSGFASIGLILRPMMIDAPVSKRFDATLLETIN